MNGGWEDDDGSEDDGGDRGSSKHDDQVRCTNGIVDRGRIADRHHHDNASDGCVATLLRRGTTGHAPGTSSLHKRSSSQMLAPLDMPDLPQIAFEAGPQAPNMSRPYGNAAASHTPYQNASGNFRATNFNGQEMMQNIDMSQHHNANLRQYAIAARNQSYQNRDRANQALAANARENAIHSHNTHGNHNNAPMTMQPTFGASVQFAIQQGYIFGGMMTNPQYGSASHRQPMAGPVSNSQVPRLAEGMPPYASESQAMATSSHAVSRGYAHQEPSYPPYHANGHSIQVPHPTHSGTHFVGDEHSELNHTHKRLRRH
jgi:hypothetical protein